MPTRDPAQTPRSDAILAIPAGDDKVRAGSAGWEGTRWSTSVYEPGASHYPPVRSVESVFVCPGIENPDIVVTGLKIPSYRPLIINT